jgi:hypothetical protein
MKDKFWLSPCGIDCQTCSIHVRTKEELAYWKDKKNLDTIRCDGCRTDPKNYHWTEHCEIYECCVLKKNHSFCSECDEFICDILKEWVSGLEHHIQSINRLKQMKKIGTTEWLSKNNFC